MLECDGNAVSMFKLGMVVAELLSSCKKTNVVKAYNFGSSLLSAFDLQILAGSHWEEDSHGGESGCCLFEFGAVLFGNFTDD